MIGWREHGSKPGSGGLNSETAIQINKRERLRQLALETIDLSKDPYIMKNHLGTYECKLCLTLHPNEGNYLSHTQGRRHQQNLARRAAKERQESGATVTLQPKKIVPKKTVVRIGRPAYRYYKQRDPQTGQLSLLFEIEYPEIEEGLQPRHRFMSTFEQKKEPVDRNWQYLLFAADPYETIAFKIPNREIERSVDPESGHSKFYTNWDKERKVFTLQLYFKKPKPGETMPPAPQPDATAAPLDPTAAYSNPLAPPGYRPW